MLGAIHLIQRHTLPNRLDSIIPGVLWLPLLAIVLGHLSENEAGFISLLRRTQKDLANSQSYQVFYHLREGKEAANLYR